MDRGTLPAQAGIGLKPEHVADLLASTPDLGFVEVHAESYMGDGGRPHRDLSRVRERYALSVHGVGLSIGGEAALDEEHLARVARLLDRYRPESFSEHLAWSTHRGRYLADLLPVPYDEPALARVCRHVDRVQTRLGRRILLENPSTYFAFARSTMSEAGFLSEVVHRTGCGLLLDLTNVHVSCFNHGLDPRGYLDGLPLHAAGEIHVAGCAADRDAAGQPLLVDDHGGPVPEPVWSLLDAVLARTAPLPVLVEWDNDVPPLAGLLAQAARARLALARTAPRLTVPA